MDLLSNPEFLDILMNRKDPASISNASDRVLQNIEFPKEVNTEQFKPEGTSIFWKGLPIAANLADAVTVKMMRDESFRDDSGRERGTEKNPLMRGLVDHPEITIPLKMGVGFGLSKLADFVGKKTNNKTVAKVLSGLFSAVPAYGAYTNLNTRAKLIKSKREGK